MTTFPAVRGKDLLSALVEGNCRGDNRWLVFFGNRADLGEKCPHQRRFLSYTKKHSPVIC